MEKALVVEDSAVDRKILRTVLARHNFDVITESTVSGAIAALSRGDFAVVLLDYVLPDGTGADVYKWLCRWSADMCSRVVVVTGSAPAEVRPAFGDETPILLKPVSPLDLTTTIDGTLALAAER